MRTAPKIEIKSALERAGSVQALADQIGYTRARIYQWINEGKTHLPELAAFRWEKRN